MKIFLRTLKPRRGGFTLLEMVLVLLIMSMLAALFASVRISELLDKKYDLTLERMNVVQQQLLIFRQYNHRLPCPADPLAGGVRPTIVDPAYGFEACAITDGDVPTKTLGLTDDYMYDGFGRRFRYVVEPNFTQACAFAHTIPLTGAGTYGPRNYPILPSNPSPGFYSGNLSIYDGAGHLITDEALYVLVSFGVNGHGGYQQSGVRFSSGSVNPNELENCDCNADGTTGTSNIAVFQDAAPLEIASNPAGNYDDILRYATREQLASQADLDGVSETCP